MISPERASIRIAHLLASMALVAAAWLATSDPIQANDPIQASRPIQAGRPIQASRPIQSGNAAPASSEAALAAEILKTTGVQGGLVVHLGCGDGKLTAALRRGEGLFVHGLDEDMETVKAARRHLREQGLYGPVCVDQLVGKRLPYIDNLANLVIAEGLGDVSREEVMRVLCPGGVAYLRERGKWTQSVKPRPKEIDEWTHYLHDATGNAVSDDSVVGPPSRLQWIGSPRFTRHHDRMSGVSAVVSSGGRVFYIFDEASHVSILLPPKWTLIARDAFNGTIEWKRRLGNWHTHLWPLKSGPAQLPRRLVSVGDRVYVTLSLDAPLTALDAATGETIRTYESTKATEEIIHSEGLLFALVNKEAKKPAFAGLKVINSAYGGKFWDEEPRELVALRANTGEVLWKTKRRILPVTLTASKRGVLFHDGQSVVCLDRTTGDPLWRSEGIERSEVIRSFYAPILLVRDDVVLFSGGETAGKQTGSWYREGKDTMTALSEKSGKVLWKAPHPPSGYRSPEDLLVLGDVVWTGETTSGRAEGLFTGRDLHTGEVVSEFQPDVETYWFHHRCYRGKATCNYLLMSRTGTEFIDVQEKKWLPHHWFRGACLYGIMPANGLIYAPQSPCACYLETKQDGFNALAPPLPGPRVPEDAESENRLRKGPAYGEEIVGKASKGDWPTYRHNAARDANASTEVPTTLREAWQANVGGKVTSPVIAEGKVLVASRETHSIHAFHAASGKHLWQYTAGGRVDSPPTVYQGRVLFGSADGWVYCLRASDGTLVWRFRAAPMDQRLVAFEQLESVWPVHGSVLVQDGVLTCVAGRSMFLDGGLRLWRLDPKTGRSLSTTVLDERDPDGEKDLQSYITWLNMPPALPDILSSDGKLVYMRSQPFDLNGKRLPLKKFPAGKNADAGAPPPTQEESQAHIFSPTGFLDDSWWHRTYWLYGSTYVSGWCGYYLAGQVAPAGRILAHDDSRVYGFGRKPQYYRWTTPIEHQLFAAAKKRPSGETAAEGGGKSQIVVRKSGSLNPVGKPLTLEAWIKSEKPGGVILARGGGSHGYALYLRNRQPHLALRMAGELTVIKAKEKVPNQWAHVAGVLTEENVLQIYVNGKLSASGKAPGLLTAEPAEAMQIGGDDGSIVGDYTGPFPFQGLMGELRVSHRALTAVEIAERASAVGQPAANKAGLVLWYTFDKGEAADKSGNGNKGLLEGALPLKDRTGMVMGFTGKGGTPPQYKVQHAWTRDLPLFARSMTLAGKTLFVAGPPDMIDEPQAFRSIDDPEVQARLAEQDAALDGKKGALLLAVSTEDGSEMARYELESPPIFDGMAAAGGRLYLVTTSGKIVCFAPEPKGKNPLFAFCMDTHDAKKRTLQEQAELLEELGYDGAGHLWLKDVPERIDTLKASGLELFQIYVRVNLDPSKPAYDAQLKDVLPLLKDRETTLALLVSGGKPSDASRDDRAVAILREIADLAAASGVRAALYPHAGDWLERVEDALRVIHKAQRENLGVMFNLCHFLKVDSEKNLDKVLTAAKPHLFAVSIHGADGAAEIQSGKGRMILPLGEGTFDMAAFLRKLHDLGYRGPMGLQCYGLPGDARVHLTQSIKAWKRLRSKLTSR